MNINRIAMKAILAAALAITAAASSAASEGLERIEADLLAINSADDERNPAELGILEREVKRAKRGRAFLIPASDQTAGHAKFVLHANEEVS